MGLIDVVCLVFLLIWALMGFRCGILHELLSIVVTLGAFLIAYLVHPMLVDISGRFLDDKTTLQHVIFLISFVVVLIVIQMLTNRFIGILGELTESGIVFKILGALAAIPRGALYLSVILWLIISFSPDSVLTGRINNSVVPTQIKKVVTFVYSHTDDILRKSNINSFTADKIIE